MPSNQNQHKPSRAFWAISTIALIWNLIGVAMYLASVTISPEALSAMTPEQRALYSDVPILITSSYAIAVFSGTLACVLLLLRKTLAVIVFAVSLIAIFLQMGYGLLFTPLLEIQGATAAIMPLTIFVIGAVLLWFSIYSRRHRYIK